MKKEKERFDCVIGRDEEGVPVLLIAPLYSFMKVGDKIKTEKGTYTVVFTESNHQFDDTLMTALFVFSGVQPQKIIKKVEETVLKWGDFDAVE